MKKVSNGIWRISLGEPEVNTPLSIRGTSVRHEALSKLPCDDISPINPAKIYFKRTIRGCTIEIPIDASEDLYGFGLQLYSFNQLGRKKVIRVNSDPVADTGDSHAPVPFYVSSAGYGVYVDTARYVSFYCGTNIKKGTSKAKVQQRKEHVAFSENELYAVRKAAAEMSVLIDVPSVEGVDLYIFSGPDILTVVQRYNLFSGGGCLPPQWGLGIWYRAYGGADYADIKRLAEEFRRTEMPVDVLGLEPGWQSHSYSCSYKWDEIRFPEPYKMLEQLKDMNYKVNLWEHVFVHPTAEFYQEMMKYSGNYEVWGGLVPDLAIEKAKKIFDQHHETKLIDRGIAGFKLDECDNSDYNASSWSFPDCASFPSGLDGEQMHNMLGLLYQDTIMSAFKNKNIRTFSQVRSSGALATALPFVLYSDLYKHKDFIRAVVNSGFSGLLWSPEVRSASSVEDLIRRVQTVVFSPQALLNCWRIPNPPWKQVVLTKNLAGEFMENYKNVQEMCRKLFKVRMSLIPYLYSAFARYYYEGIPPFRALVMDYPEDSQTREIDDQYLMGDSMLIAPLVLEDNNYRKIYLPNGIWYDFWTNERYQGGQIYEMEVELERIPVFVKGGSMIPYAQAVDYVEKDTCFNIIVKCYGNPCKEFVLFEDDGSSFNYERGIYNTVKLKWSEDGKHTIVREGRYKGQRYNILGWELID